MTIECANCKAQNPNRNRFCGDCGAPLGPASIAMKDMRGTALREQVSEIIRTQYKDQKVVEIETAQAIATRLTDWAKLLGFFVGIPIAILLLILGGLGIKTYSDFSSQVEKAQKDVNAHLTAAQASATKLKDEGDSLARDYEKLRVQFADTAALAAQVDILSKKVDVIGEKLGFTPSSNVSPALKARLEAAFGKFQQYAQHLGYRSTDDLIEIHIPEKMEVGMISYYDVSNRRMVIDSKYAGDPVILYREYMHHVLLSLGIPANADSKLSAYYAIESALAWYFPCSFVNDPRPARAATKWDLTKKRSFSELTPDINAALTDGTEIWGSAFWELRQTLGQEVADKLFFDAWFKLRAEEVQTNGGAAFVHKLLNLDNAHQAQIRAVFTQRDLAL